MKKILIVARREYIATIRRKAFIILTIGMPVFFLILFGLSAVGSMLAARSEAKSSLPVGIVDEAGVVDMGLLEKVRASFPAPKAPAKGVDSLSALRDLQDFDSKMALMRSQIEIRKFDRREDARSAFLNKEIRGYYVVPPDFLKDGAIRLVIRKGGFLSESRPAWSAISRLLQASILEGKVNDDLGRRIWIPPKVESTQMSETGEVSGSGTAEEFADFAVPYFAALFFMISIIGTSGYLLQGVAEEKENRVIEVLISSVTTDQLLAGKVLGLCGAGLTPTADLDHRWGNPGRHDVPVSWPPMEPACRGARIFPAGIPALRNADGGVWRVGEQLQGKPADVHDLDNVRRESLLCDDRPDAAAERNSGACAVLHSADCPCDDDAQDFFGCRAGVGYRPVCGDTGSQPVLLCPPGRQALPRWSPDVREATFPRRDRPLAQSRVICPEGFPV